MKSSMKISIAGFFLISLTITAFLVLNGTNAQLAEKVVLAEDSIRIQTKTGVPIMDVQLLENTYTCLTDCYAIIRFRPYQDIVLPDAADSEFRWDFIKAAAQMPGLASYSFEILTNVSYEETVPVYGNVSYSCFNNVTDSEDTCWRTEQTDSTTETRYRDEFKSFSFWDQTLQSGTNYTIKLTGKKQAQLGPNNVDWVPTLKGVQLNEWDWWNTSWKYNKPINISVPSGTTEKDYQILLAINTSSISDKIRPDCGDLRFVNSSETGELNYWINGTCNLTGTTYVFVKVDQNITTNGYTVYMYYNNSVATSNSNATNTMEFFDDFSDASIDTNKWTPYKEQYGHYGISNGAAYIGGTYDTTVAEMKLVGIWDKNIAVYWWTKQPSTAGSYHSEVCTKSGDSKCWSASDYWIWQAYIGGTTNKARYCWAENAWSHDDLDVITSNNEYYGKFTSYNNSGTWNRTGYYRNISSSAWTLIGYFQNTSSTPYIRLSTNTYGPVIPYDYYYDDFFITKYHYPEPTYVFGNESEYTNCPTDDTYITDDTTYSLGVCNVWDDENDGIIKINTSNIILDCNGMILNGTNPYNGEKDGVGIYVGYGVGNVTIKNCVLENLNVGVEIYNMTGFTLQTSNISYDVYGIVTWNNLYESESEFNVVNSEIENNEDSDIVMWCMVNMTANFINSTYSSLNIQDAALINRQWYVLANVSNDTSQIDGAQVETRDKFGNLEWYDTTDLSGLTEWHPVTEYVQTNTTTTYYAPHTFLANHSQLGMDEISANITTNTVVNLTIGFWNVTFNVTSGEDGSQLNNVNIYCNYSGFSQGGDTTNPYGNYSFPQDTWSCVFEKDSPQYYNKTTLFAVNSDMVVDIVMGLKGELTNQEHEWLEKLYNCLYLGIEEDCETTNQINSVKQTGQDTNSKVTSIQQYVIVINQTIQQVNNTMTKLWDNTKPTDKSVVLEETEISNVVNDTYNITYNYSVYVPVKQGYDEGAFLPVRISYWFLTEDNQSCYSQSNESLVGFDLIEPYCVPLTVYTIGKMDSVINFTVQLRPVLPEGSYNIVRSIDIDPDQVWVNHGMEEIGNVEIQKPNDEMMIGVSQTIQSTVNNPVTGLIIGDIINPINISIILSVCAIGTIGLLTIRKKF